MKHILLTGLLGLGIVSSAQAGMVTLNELQNQTSDGQDFTFTFNPVMPSDGTTSGQFILHARGDYGTSEFEVLSWDIEGVVSAGPVGAFSAGGIGGMGGPFDTIIEHAENVDYEFTRSYTISAADLQSITADGIVTINVDLDQGELIPQFTQYVEVTLNYGMASTPIPEPSTFVLLGIGGLALAGYRLRRNRQPAA